MRRAGRRREQHAGEETAERTDGRLGTRLLTTEEGEEERNGAADDDDGADHGGEEHDVEGCHEREGSRERDGSVHDHDDAHRRSLTEEHSVGGHSRHQLSGRASREFGNRRTEEPAHERTPCVEYDPLGQPAQHEPLSEAQRSARDDQADEYKHQRRDAGWHHSRAARYRQLVEDVAYDEGYRERSCGEPDTEHECRDQPTPVRPDMSEERAEVPGDPLSLHADHERNVRR